MLVKMISPIIENKEEALIQAKSYEDFPWLIFCALIKEKRGWKIETYWDTSEGTLVRGQRKVAYVYKGAYENCN